MVDILIVAIVWSGHAFPANVLANVSDLEPPKVAE